MTDGRLALILIAAGAAVPLVPLTIPCWGLIADIAATIGITPVLVFLVAWRCAVLARGPSILIGGAESPYLRRWYIIPRNKWFNVYLHHFLRSDDDRALHDHPWWNVSIILRGAYREHLPDGSAPLRRAGRLYGPRPPESLHRIALLRSAPGAPERPVWTLFLTGPRVREWGFDCPGGWRHWQDFTADNGTTIGRGCDD